MIFETHAHYDDSAFADDRDELLRSMTAGGIGKIINVGASIESSKMALELAGKYEHVYAAIGVHPSEISDLNEETFSWLQSRTDDRKVVAVGEIGLDYYWEKDPVIQERQRQWFLRQLALAQECGLPVIIHSRDAAEDTVRILKEQKPTGRARGVIHCYSYSPELAEEFVKLGYYIGVGGVVTFKNAKKLKETVEKLPLECILLETDCPYMAPEPHRGTRNQSLYLPYVADKIAELKGVTREVVEHVTWENALTLFGRSA